MKQDDTNVDKSANELHLATIGAILISELFKSRLLRKKIRGTNLEKQLKQILNNDTFKGTASADEQVQKN
jgi:hypothetical protein